MVLLSYFIFSPEWTLVRLANQGLSASSLDGGKDASEIVIVVPGKVVFSLSLSWCLLLLLWFVLFPPPPHFYLLNSNLLNQGKSIWKSLRQTWKVFIQTWCYTEKYLASAYSFGKGRRKQRVHKHIKESQTSKALTLIRQI